MIRYACRLRFFLMAVCVFSQMATTQAQISIDRFYPPVVGAGNTQVTAEGKISEWPCKVICDREDIEVQPGKDEGRLTVIVPQDVAPGVAWIRIAGQQHASRLVPLLISNQPVLRETGESNNHFEEAEAVDLPAVIAGRLGKGGDVDCFRVTIQKGKTLIVSVIANEILRSPMDAVLQITDTKGNVLAQAEDDRVLDPQLVFRAKADTEIVVRIFAFPETPNSTVGLSGASGYTYAMRMTTGPFLDHVHPVLIGNPSEEIQPAPRGWSTLKDIRSFAATSISPPTWYSTTAMGWHWNRAIASDAATMLESSDPNAPRTTKALPVVFAGQISEPKQVDRIRFQVEKGKSYTALSYSRKEGFRVDTVLRVIDPKTEKEIVRKDDISRTKFDSEISFKAREDGELELQVSDAVDAFGLRHMYAVLLREAQPTVQLSVAEDHYELKAGEKREIEVQIERDNGFAKTLKLIVDGLPKGVTVSQAFSEPKGDTAKSVKLQFKSMKDVSFQGNIQFRAIEMEGERETDVSHFACYQLLNKLQLKDIWLTVGSKRAE